MTRAEQRRARAAARRARRIRDERIVRALATGEHPESIAQRYGITREHVYAIAKPAGAVSRGDFVWRGRRRRAGKPSANLGPFAARAR